MRCFVLALFIRYYVRNKKERMGRACSTQPGEARQCIVFWQGNVKERKTQLVITTFPTNSILKGYSAHIMKLPSAHLCPFCCNILFIEPKYPNQRQILENPQSMFFTRSERDQVLNPYKTTRNATSVRIFWQPSSFTETQMKQSRLCQLVKNCFYL